MRKLKYILFILMGIIAAIYILNSTNKNRGNNGFTRKFSQPQILFKTIFKPSVGTFAFTGRLDSTIKLNIYSDRFNLYQIGYLESKLDTIKVKYPTKFNLATLNIYKDKQGSDSYFSNPFGDISIFNGRSAKYYKANKIRFDFIQAVSPNSIIVRSWNSNGQQLNRSLSKVTLTQNVKVSRQFLLPAIKDGLFANDGMLLYDKMKAKIFYLYYYRGELLSLDTNLNVIYKVNTIDTVSKAKIKTAIINSKGANGDITRRIIMATTPKLVNSYITINQERIYIISELKADNENAADFYSNNVVDVYDINKGQYLHSFYVPKYNGEKLSSFQIIGNKLITIYSTFLVSYQFEEHN